MPHEILREGTPGGSADSDLSAGYLFVKLTATGSDASGVGELADGMLINCPEQGDAVAMQCAGVRMIRASAVMAPGDEVASAAGGECKVAASGEFILGKVHLVGGGVGDLVPVLFNPGGRKA